MFTVVDTGRRRNRWVVLNEHGAAYVGTNSLYFACLVAAYNQSFTI